MEPESSITLVLCGKSNEEKEIAHCLKSNNTLKLPDGSPVTVSLHSETESRESVINDNVFRINSYMNFLSTSRFGRLLVYSPRLASTHDVVTTYVFPFLSLFHFHSVFVLMKLQKDVNCAYLSCINLCCFLFEKSGSNFGELPCGSVCVADVQFKGRGIVYFHNACCNSI